MIKTVKYGYAREKKQNPYVGFTSFQHFRNDALYSDLIVRPEKTEADILSWLPGEHNEAFEIPVPSDLSEGEYELQIGIGGGDKPSVCFATDAPCDGDFAVLAQVKINK